MFKSLGIGVLILALTACGAPRARHGTPAGPQPPPPAAPPGAGLPGTVDYKVDEAQSELRVLVFRAGPLARFGHNHVMVNRTIHGAVSVTEAAGPTAFRLTIPAAGFVVDDADARAQEGADFAAAVPDDARAGTLHNMLSDAVLDAAEFPSIEIKSVRISAATATVTVGVAGHESTIEVPFDLKSEPRTLSANGTVDLRQTDLGLTPYSLMLGALQVQDSMTIKFKIVASM